ncbi:MAG: RsmD family RNA methyltransferase [Actinomycetota bacterium]
MRVIAGTARGARLARVPPGTRPLSDRAREGLFSSLGGRVPGARVGDLFAGTGAVGIEALSRGAACCVFVDSSAAAIRTIRENLDRTGLGERATVVRSEVDGALGREPGPFDLAVLDPPYAYSDDALRAVMARLARLMAPGGALALTRPKADSNDVIPVHWAVVRLLTYGDTRILVLQEAV